MITFTVEALRWSTASYFTVFSQTTFSANWLMLACQFVVTIFLAFEAAKGVRDIGATFILRYPALMNGGSELLVNVRIMVYVLIF